MDSAAGDSGDRDPLRLFLSQRAELVRYAQRITGDLLAAEDVVQESWLRFSAAHDRQAIDEPRGLLFRIVRNLALDGRRRQGLETRIFAADSGDVAERIAADEPSVQTRAEAADDLERVRVAIARMPERTRRAFVLHRIEGLKLVEIAERLGISKSLAHQLVVDGVELCRKALRAR